MCCDLSWVQNREHMITFVISCSVLILISLCSESISSAARIVLYVCAGTYISLYFITWAITCCLMYQTTQIQRRVMSDPDPFQPEIHNVIIANPIYHIDNNMRLKTQV